jgi:hypothetical protein
MSYRNTTKQGFALLMTLVIVSVVISIGLTLLELTVKQLRLATGSKDSENAFHAANAGMECARYWRLASSTEFENGTGSTVPMSCFNSAVTRPTQTSRGGAGELVFQYDVQFTWGATGAQRCSKITFITLSSDPASAGVTLPGVATYIPGYPYADKTCIAGGRCTIVSSQGYNQPCSAIGTIGTVQREVLLEL